MKALSLYEPWATLIALKLKRFETRSWSTTYRGPLVICASIKHPPIWRILDILYRAKISFEDCSPGRAVCIVYLTNILPTTMIDFYEGPLGENEKSYGDFFPGRFAWKLENVRRFKKPFPVRGRQGLFEIPNKLIEENT